MLSSLLSRPKISVTLAQESLFVHPRVETSAVWDENQPSPDPLVSGTVLLSLPAPKAINKIRVTLEGLCDAFGGDGTKYESTTTLSKEVSIDLGGEVLEVGNHAFNFSFIIPSSTAVYQRCNYGRVRHSVKATCYFTGTFAGSVSTHPVGIFVTANPSRPGELPLPTNIDIQHFNKDLGPVGVQINSPHLTVASLLSVRVAIPSPPTQVDIKSINSTIQQSFEVHYSDGSIARPPVQKHLLTKVGMKASPSLAVPICTTECGSDAPESSDDLGPEPAQRFLKKPLPCTHEPGTSPSPCCPPKADVPEFDPIPLTQIQPNGDEFVYHRMFRCPTDDHIRPTSVEGSDNRIRVSHAIVIEIRYRPMNAAPGDPDQILTVIKPLSISSCCCLLDSLYLPVYVKKSPKTIVRPLKDMCLCNMTLEAMMDRDGEALQRASTIEEPTGEARSFGCDRSTKSPTYSESSSYASSLQLPTPPNDD